MAGAQVQISLYFISELLQIKKPCQAWVKQMRTATITSAFLKTIFAPYLTHGQRTHLYAVISVSIVDCVGLTVK